MSDALVALGLGACEKISHSSMDHDLMQSHELNI